MAAKQQRGLGRGLGAVLGADADLTAFRRPVQYVNQIKKESANDSGNICLLDINNIDPNPYQPRVSFDEQALNELAASIKTLGLIQPITVRNMNNGRYQIISGERRFRASRIAGLSDIPAYVRSTDDRGMLEMAIVENVQRFDLDPIETAMSYQRLIDECRLTQEQMADRIGKSRVSVTNYLRLLKLPAKVQYDLKVGNISVGHAKVLLGIEDGTIQEKLTDAIVKEGLSVRALEERIRNLRSGEPVRRSSEECAELSDDDYGVVEFVGRYFGNNVSIRKFANGKGVLTVKFENDAQISAFLNDLKKMG